MRAIKNDETNGLKAAVRRSVDLAGGGAKFSLVTRVNGPTISKYGKPEDWANDKKEDIGNLPGIDVAVECDREAGSPIIVGAMAELLGYRLVPLDGPDNAEPPAVTIKDALLLANEAGDAVRELTLALDDDRMSADEKIRVLRELEQMNRCSRALIKRIGGSR